MKFKDFKKQGIKSVDSWTDVFIINHFSVLLTFIVCKLFKSKKTPYVITILSFLFRVIAGFSFYFHHILWGVIFVMLGFIFDGADGQISRVIFGKDPQIRGTLDFVLDHVSVIFIYIGIVNAMLFKAPFLINLYIFYLVSHIFLMALTSTKFRLNALHGINPNQTLLSTGKIKGKMGILIKNIESKFKKFKLIMHPSIVDSNLVIWVLFPLLNFNIWALLIAILFMWIDLVLTGIVPIYYLLKSN